MNHVCCNLFISTGGIGGAPFEMRCTLLRERVLDEHAAWFGEVDEVALDPAGMTVEHVAEISVNSSPTSPSDAAMPTTGATAASR